MRQRRRKEDDAIQEPWAEGVRLGTSICGPSPGHGWIEFSHPLVLEKWGFFCLPLALSVPNIQIQLTCEN
jgi:hypothetical protein